MRDLLFRFRQTTGTQRPAHPCVRALGGLGLLVLAVIFIVGGFELGVGSPRRLGTGAFPVITGFLLALLSLAVIAADLSETTQTERPDWMSFLAIGAALAVFSLTVGRIGLVPGVFLTVITASLPDRSLPILGKLALGVLVSLCCWGLFIGLIGLPFSAFGGL